MQTGTQDHIGVWTVALRDVSPGCVTQWQTLLCPDEQARADRFVFDSNRTEYIAAHALVRLVLAQMTGHPPQHLTFTPDAGGKPFLSLNGQAAPLSFSLSHTAGCVGLACVADPVARLGFDLEFETRRIHPRTADHVFSAAENAWLDQLPAEARDQGFMRLWTLKEAYVKAIGTGLREPLDQFSFASPPSQPDHQPHISFADGRDARQWRFEQQHLPSGHFAALGWHSDRPLSTTWTHMQAKDVIQLAASAGARLSRSNARTKDPANPPPS